MIVDSYVWEETEHVPFAILHVDLINISHYTHNTIDKDACKLYHSKDPSDFLTHVFQEHEPKWQSFGTIDHVFIERQPPLGLTQIESLLFHKYRDRVLKISPNSMHKRFSLPDEYEKRKERVVELAGPFFTSFPQYVKASRHHDIADAMLLALHQLMTWQSQAKAKLNESLKKDRLNKSMIAMKECTADEWFEKFRYVANSNIA